MNFRSRALLDLCYEFDCLLRVDGVCTGGVGEPCHANWSRHGKGMSIKAHDCYAVPGCRACHNWLDQGPHDGEIKYSVWTEAFWKYLAMLWNRGMLKIAITPDEARREGLPEKEGTDTTPHSLPPSRRRKGSKRGTHCTRPSKVIPRGERIV